MSTDDALLNSVLIAHGRICPGRQLADQTLWLAIVTVLAVLDIRKARNESGEEIIPEAAFVSGGIRYAVSS